ncbi:MAG: HAMP domain-containing histidine kinase [Ramlibacter sp.]|nr:HAMP domain-containing histidine kinase [Ramlibacter sp.]
MYQFLNDNREELIARCKKKVAARPKRAATPDQLKNGIPRFLNQLTRTLQAEQMGNAAASSELSAPVGVTPHPQTEMGVTAAAHGKELLGLGFTVDQVVHDYGDLCQAITELAHERDAPFAVDEFRTLNGCLVNAIADAVTEFSFQRDAEIEKQRSADANQRLGFLVHELRNALATALLALTALELGQLPIAGATGTVLKRSLKTLESLLAESLDEVRAVSTPIDPELTTPLAAFIEQARRAADLQAHAKGHRLLVSQVDPALGIRVNTQAMSAALGNLLGNAFKFTQANTEIRLDAYAQADKIFIDVTDHCGGLPEGDAQAMFKPFVQSGEDRSGVGLGLSIARRAVEADGGELSVRNLPGSGCVFTITLPRYPLVPAA